jgi:hypothetical protein
MIENKEQTLNSSHEYTRIKLRKNETAIQFSIEENKFIVNMYLGDEAPEVLKGLVIALTTVVNSEEGMKELMGIFRKLQRNKK